MQQGEGSGEPPKAENPPAVNLAKRTRILRPLDFSFGQPHKVGRVPGQQFVRLDLIAGQRVRIIIDQ